MERLIKFTLKIIFCIACLTGCFPQDLPVRLPPPGDVQQVMIEMGNNYEQAVFFDFSTGIKKSVPFSIYDLAFEADAQGFRVRLNTGKLMYAWNTEDTIDKIPYPIEQAKWRTDTPDGSPDSTTIGNWKANQIYIIDRGRIFYTQPNERYKKLRLLQVNETTYYIAFAGINEKDWQFFQVNKNNLYDNIYFSFDGQGKVVDFAPPKKDWDIVFIQYQHIFYDQPPPTYYYLVRGTLLNTTNETMGAAVDTLFERFPQNFEAITIDSINRFTFTKRADIIGYKWKDFDYQGNYYILPRNYYLIQDNEGFYYKMKFYDFYNTNGQKGFPQFLYQRL